jgi:hypothetical protein
MSSYSPLHRFCNPAIEPKNHEELRYHVIYGLLPVDIGYDIIFYKYLKEQPTNLVAFEPQ